MIIRLQIILIILFTITPTALKSQVIEDNLIQFSGVVITVDSLKAVSFANIIVKESRRGTTCDYYGYFSFVAKKKDTIIFSAVGYKTITFIIPDTITKTRYSLIQAMTSDTLLLDETMIFPWPSTDQFKQAFINLEVPDDDYLIAKRNLALSELRERAQNFPMDGSMNYKHYMDQQYYKLYYAGQSPPLTIFNPFAWAEFIKAWRDGKFKRKKDK
ncbi:MAG: carboxypeptidase-like regulatory domain-containing protein [Bacteroidales bacterium]|nr:carboxypeptidase-like regulatory domain-containing protein [Bacteroidales bacterium]